MFVSHTPRQAGLRDTLWRSWRAPDVGRARGAEIRSTSATRRPGRRSWRGCSGGSGADPRGGTLRRGRVRARADDGRARGALRPGDRAGRLARDAGAGKGERRRRRTSSSVLVSGESLEVLDEGVADALICYLVLQHLPARRGSSARTCAEFARVLAPDGEAFVQVPVLAAAAEPRLWRAARRPLLARRSPARSRRGVPRLPADPARARRRARRRRPAGGSPRTRGRRAYRFCRDRFLRLASRMTAAALAVYGILLAVALVAVLRRPAVALYLFVLRLPLHNIVMSLLYGGGVRGGALDAISGVEGGRCSLPPCSRSPRVPGRSGGCRSVPTRSTRSRSPTRRVVVLYAVIPQGALGGARRDEGGRCTGSATTSVIVAAYFLGRSLPLDVRRVALDWSRARRRRSPRGA